MFNEKVISAESLIGREFWYITDIWETLCAVPVMVKSVSEDGELTIVWKVTDEYSEEYDGISITELYTSRQEAGRVISKEPDAMTLTLGSLFDGAGGFPLAGVHAGFTPVWASEIEPFPIRVTTRRFPHMKHIGDITRVSGAEIEPVDCITFGSPCQDLSVANGNRKGLDGVRSGLFREAIRIIKEMREATHGKYPTFIVWENVTGAFSSNGGEDFRQVLEEIARVAEPEVVIPRPADGKWTNTGEIMGDTYSIAYRLYDAQFWGVPQRRRRIYLVADFRGGRAGRVQFERERMFGHITTCVGEGQAVAGEAESSPVSTGGIDYLTPWDAQSKRVFDEKGSSPTLDGSDGGGGRNPGGLVIAAAFISGQSVAARGIGYSEKVTPTLKSAVGGNTVPCIMTAGFNGHKSITGSICYNEERSPCIETHMPPNVLEPILNEVQSVYGLVSKSSNSWKSRNPDSGCYETDRARTIDTNGGYPACNQGGNIVVYPDKARSLTAHHDSSPCVDRGQNFIAIENHAQDSRVKLSGDVFQTLPDKMGTGGNNTPMVLCLDRASYHQGQNAKYNISVKEELSQTLVAKGPHAVAYDCRNHAANDEVSSTLQAKKGGGYSLNYINPVFTIGNGQADQLKLHEKAGTLNCMHDQQAIMVDEDTKYRVRRLTPLECCRLQGFPDCWTRGLKTEFEPLTCFDDDGNEHRKANADEIASAQAKEIDWWREVFETHRLATDPTKKPRTRRQVRRWLMNPYSDSAEYKMWGNSLAIPCAYTVLAGIADELRNEDLM